MAVLKVKKSTIDKIEAIYIPRETRYGVTKRQSKCLRMYWEKRRIDILPDSLYPDPKVNTGWDVDRGQIVYFQYVFE